MSLWRHALRDDRRGRAWLGVLLSLLAVALGADLLASDLPLAVRVDQQTFWLPCVTHPVALRASSQRTLQGRAEWMVGTPVPFGPHQTVASTGGERAEPPPWAPDGTHWLGTDEVGRDVLARLIHGARVSLFIALFTVLLASLVGLLVGGLSGYLGGAWDAVLSRITEVMTTFPTVFFLLALLAIVRSQALWPLVVVLGLTRWTDIARLVRGEVLRLKGLDFVKALTVMGASRRRILLSHLLPNALGPVLVSATFGIGASVLLESSLSFLGIGVAPPTASWESCSPKRTARCSRPEPGGWRSFQAQRSR